jgi:hypothetical protein
MWHEASIANITEILSQDQHVKGLLLVGSCTRDDVQTDEWSDIDIAVIVDDEAITRFYPATDWVRRFGTTYAFSINETDCYHVIRVWFTDGRHFDFIIVEESSLARIDD